MLFQDVPLFEGIISDLFPGVECPKPDYGVFMEALKDNIAKRNLQPVPWFLDKIIQVCIQRSITLKIPNTTVAVDKFCNIFINYLVKLHFWSFS